MTTNKSYPHILSKLISTPMMIQEEALLQMIDIVNGVRDIEAVRTKLSERLPGTEVAGVREGVAHIPISGPIFPKANLFTQISGATSVSSLALDLQTAIDNDEVESIILDIDSPGGAVTGINEMANIIRSSTEKKDITAYVNGSASSAAYWLASAANEVVIDATARVGSIGVVVAYPNSKDEESVEIWNTASPNKRIDISTDKGKNVIVKELDALADVFITSVAEFRNTTPGDVVANFGKGAVLIGKNAVDVGMADRLGSFEGLLAEKSNINNDGGFIMDEDKVVDQKAAPLTADSIKASDPDVYESIMNLGKEEGKASVQNVVDSKDSEISNLLDTITASDERLKALEKIEVIRAEREMKVVAEGVVTKSLTSSMIPSRLHEKIHATLSYGQFVSEGKLNVADFSEFVATEIIDWETNLNDDTVQGFGSAPKSVDNEAMGNVDDLVNRMTSSAGQTIQ